MNNAVIFDFDQTMSPGTMFDPVLKAWGFEPDDFWESCNVMRQNDDGFDMEHSYLYRLVEEGRAAVERRLDDCRMRVWGRAVPLYEGLASEGDNLGLLEELKAGGSLNFVISGGLKPVVEGCLTRRGLQRAVDHVFACRMAEEDPQDGYGSRLSFPKEVVNFTVKTQKLFAIKKGSWRPEKHMHVNDKLEPGNGEVPFENMLYIGDGLSDVAAFATINRFGGTSLAVFDPSHPGAREKAMQLKKDRRVHQAFEADYREGSPLRKAILDWVRVRNVVAAA